MNPEIFKDQIRVLRIENRVPRIREIGSLLVHTGCLIFSLKNLVNLTSFSTKRTESVENKSNSQVNIRFVAKHQIQR